MVEQVTYDQEGISTLSAVYLIDKGVVDRTNHNAEERPIILGYPQSEIERQRELFRDC